MRKLGEVLPQLLFDGPESATSCAPSSEQKSSARPQRLVEAAAIIQGTRPAGNELAFLHSALCQVSWPRSQVSSDTFSRRSGDYWIHIQAGLADLGAGPQWQTIPWGVLPRVVMIHLSSFAVRNKTAVVPVEDSASAFLRVLGRTTDGARHDALRTQLYALAAARVQCGWRGVTLNGHFIRGFEMWTSGPSRKWPKTLVLAPEYFDSLRSSAVPLDLRAVHALRRSALAIDIYSWLAHRLWRLKSTTFVRWPAVYEQFGAGYCGSEGRKNFRKEFSLRLRSALAVYPAANCRPVRGGLLLKPSTPPISRSN